MTVRKIDLIPKIRELVLSTKRYKVAKGGRGSGKSYGIGCIMAVKGITESNIKILCTRETQNSLSDSTLAILKRVIRDYGLEGFFTQTKHGLQTITGSEYIFRGLQNPDRIKSLDDIKYCWVAEAQQITNEAWDMLIPTIRADDSEIWIDFNPDSETDPVAARFVETIRKDVIVRHLTYKDLGRFLPDVLKHELEYDFMNDPEKAAWVWDGQYRKISNALVFNGRFSIQTFTTPQNVNFYHGIDWGFSNDPTCLVRCFIVGRTLFIDREAWGLHVELDDLATLFDTIETAREWKSLADDSRPETISHVKRKGFNIEGAKKPKGSVEDGIAYLKSFEKIVIHTKCTHTIEEFKTYSYILDRRTGEPTPRLEDKNNHCIDALRYALSLVRKPRQGKQGGAGLNVM